MNMRITAMMEPNDAADGFNWWVKAVDNEGREYHRAGSNKDYAAGKTEALQQAREMGTNIIGCMPIKEFVLYDDYVQPPIDLLT